MWVNVDQNTDEWFNLRLGKATSSNFDKIMANNGKPFGNPAIEYSQKIALELVTNERDESYLFTNKYMDRGHELEPVAIRMYEVETLHTVINGGFYVSIDKKLGDSPDGLIGGNGCIEVKSVIPNTQWKRLKNGGIDNSYKWQVHGHIWIGNKDWCDFISFCPEMPKSKQLYIERVYRDEEIIKLMNDRLSLFMIEVEKNVQILKQRKN